MISKDKNTESQNDQENITLQYPEVIADQKYVSIPKSLGMIVAGFMLFLAITHIYVALDLTLSELERNALHFGGFSLLAAILYPMSQSWGKDSRMMLTLNTIFGLLVFASAWYMTQAEDAIYARGVRLITLDWIAAFICIAGAFELTRRLVGLLVPMLIVISITYITVWGQYVSGIFQFPGLSWETVIFRSIYGDDALFGGLASISSTYVFLFIIFGAFLVRSGAGDFVISLSRAVAGRMVGGPGIIAVISSGLTGTISGSAVANTASTGVITIPLMKRAGFEPKFAAGVEAASSTGGQLMPPIMGAGAFVMASLTEISYEYIIVVAALPALLYFLSVAFFVRIEAKKHNLPPMPAEGETLWSALKYGGASFILPIGLLIYMLVAGYTPTYAAAAGIVSVTVSSWLTANPMGPKAVIEALIMGSKNMIMIAVLLCSVGLVVNVIATAGIGNTFSQMITAWSDGNVMIAIVLVALASLILGMGLPVTAAYIILATLSAPALAGMISDQIIIAQIVSGELNETAKSIMMIAQPDALTLLSNPLPRPEATALIHGLPLEVISPIRDMSIAPEIAVTTLLSAHMIVFWLSQDSNVTPPVALAAITAAGIADSDPFKTSVASWKFAKGLYIMPILFAYTPLLSGNWSEMLTIFGFAVFGIYGIAGAIQGCLENRIGALMRLLVGVAGIACLWPHDLMINIIGLIAVIILVIWNVIGQKNQSNSADTSSKSATTA